MHYSVDPNSSSFHACFGDPNDPDNLYKIPFPKVSTPRYELRLKEKGGLGIFATAHIPKDEKLIDELPVLTNPPDFNLQDSYYLTSAFRDLNTIHRVRVATLPRPTFRYNKTCDNIDLQKQYGKKVDETSAKIDWLNKELERVRLAEQGGGESSETRKNRKGKRKRGKRGGKGNKGKGKAKAVEPVEVDTEDFRCKEPEIEDAKCDEGAALSPGSLDAQALDHWHIALFTILKTRATSQGLCPTMALINHSCLPNYEVVGNDLQVELWIRKDINPGDELTRDYISAIACMPDQRFDVLSQEYGLICECPYCSSPDKKRILSDQAKIQRLARDFDFLAGQILSRSQGSFISTLTPSLRGTRLFGPFPPSVAIDFDDPAKVEAVTALTEFQRLMRQSKQRSTDAALMYTAAAKLAWIINDQHPTAVNSRRWAAFRSLASLPRVPDLIGPVPLTGPVV